MNGFEACRKRAGLTQVEAAKAIGASQGSISQWESGLCYPPVERLKRVAEVYGCTVDELLGKDESA